MVPICFDCDDEYAGFEDPRSPPLEVGDEVLCYSCFSNAADEVIEGLNAEIDRLKGMQNAT